MSTFEFPPSIISRPVYGTLAPRRGKHHLMIADAEGAEALLELAGKDAALMPRAHIIYVSGDVENPFVEKLRNIAPLHLYVGPSYNAAVPRLRRMLQDAHMGLQVYLAGTEGLMGQAMLEATSAGIGRAPDAMRSLQGHYGKCHNRSVYLFALWAASVCARPLLAPHCRLSGGLR